MADDVVFQSTTLATPPAGTVVSADENVTSGKVQRMKLAMSADGSDTHVQADSDGLLVNLGANNDVVVSGTVTVTEPVSVDDNAGSLTVDAPVGTPVNVRIGDGTDTALVTAEGNLQTITPNRTASGTLGALNDAVTIDCSGAAVVWFYVASSDLLGTAVIDTDLDGSTWNESFLVGYDDWNQVFSTTIDDPSAQQTFTLPCSGFRRLRLRVSAYTSGSAVVHATTGPELSGTNLPLEAVRLFASTQTAPPVPIAVASDGGLENFALRVTLASDSTGLLSVDDNGASLTVDNAAMEASLSVLDDWDESDRAKVNPIAGQAGVQGGAGASTANTQRVAIATDANAISGTVTAAQATASSLNATVVGTGTFAVQESGAALTALQLIDDTVYTDDTSTHATGTSKGNLFMAAAAPTDAAVNANDIGAVAMTTDRKLHVSVQDAIPAGTNNIGDVDVLTVPAPLSTTGGGTEATALRVTVANDSTGVLSVDDNGGTLTVDAPVGTPVFTRLSDGSAALIGQKAMTASLPVVVASDQSNIQIVGAAAHAAPASGNPVYVAGRASTAVPTDVGADGDAAALWTQRNGAPVVTMAPHMGLVGSPWTLASKTAQYTTTQTSAVLQAGGASEKIVVTKVQIQVGGTTAGTLQLYFGTGAYSRGTSFAIFDGEFAPSATLKPGVIMDGPFIAGTNGDDVLVTTSAALNPLTITIWYYLVT